MLVSLPRRDVSNMVLSSKVFPNRTEGKSMNPSESHAERRDVPTFILEKLEHLMPKWQAKSSWTQRSKARRASLSCIGDWYVMIYIHMMHLTFKFTLWSGLPIQKT